MNSPQFARQRRDENSDPANHGPCPGHRTWLASTTWCRSFGSEERRKLGSTEPASGRGGANLRTAATNLCNVWPLDAIDLWKEPLTFAHGGFKSRQYR